MSSGINDCADQLCDFPKHTEYELTFYKYHKDGKKNYFCTLHTLNHVMHMDMDERITIRRLTEEEKNALV